MSASEVVDINQGLIAMEAWLCDICGGKTELLDVVDLNKNCGEPGGKYLPLSGFPVYYRICSECDFTFCSTMYGWTDAEFLEKIYNRDYASLDPDYSHVRPQGNAALIRRLFPGHAGKLRHLDYGGGNGLLSNLMLADGWQSISYDPFPASDVDLKSLGQFDLITSFEVFEHVPGPSRLMENVCRLLADDGLVLFSTLQSDKHLVRNSRISWWYCSPRNGHISLYSSKSLKMLANRYGFRVGSFNTGVHLFYRNIPTWATHLFQGQQK